MRTQRIAPPLRRGVGQQSDLPVGPKPTAKQSIATGTLNAKTPRSVQYSTHYRVGMLDHCAVYFHPLSGLAVEKDHSYLVGLRGDCVIEWTEMPELIEAHELNPSLVKTLPDGLYSTVYKLLDDFAEARFQDECDCIAKESVYGEIPELHSIDRSGLDESLRSLDRIMSQEGVS